MIHPVLGPIILTNRMIDLFCCRFFSFASISWFIILPIILSIILVSSWSPESVRCRPSSYHNAHVILPPDSPNADLFISVLLSWYLVSSCTDKDEVVSSWYHPAWLILLSSFTDSSLTSACNNIFLLGDLSSWYHPAFSGEGVRWLIILASTWQDFETTNHHHPGIILVPGRDSSCW